MESVSIAAPSARPKSVWCTVMGHRVDNRSLSLSEEARCPCGEEYLATDGTQTRMGHTFSCFFFGHVYVEALARDVHVEYVCERCGHPLVLDHKGASFKPNGPFRKSVRYLCGLLGHRVHSVTERNGFAETACHCGHSFLSAIVQGEKVRHPMACVIKGHYITFVENRSGYAEFRCAVCGHPFCFAIGEARQS